MSSCNIIIPSGYSSLGIQTFKGKIKGLLGFGYILVSLDRLSECALLGTSEIQGDERERGSADSEQDSVTSARMLAEPIRLQKSCDSVLIR